jgi:hypothetical protein
VRLEPGATVTGRLVDPDGKPRAGVELQVSFRPKAEREWELYFPERIQTDREGRFRIVALLPGYEFRLFCLTHDKGELQVGGARLRSGQTTDLGDVQMTRTKQ